MDKYPSSDNECVAGQLCSRAHCVVRSPQQQYDLPEADCQSSVVFAYWQCRVCQRYVALVVPISADAGKHKDNILYKLFSDFIKYVMHRLVL